MARLIILGATGSLGRHILGQALGAGHQVTVLVRTPAKLPPEVAPLVSIHTGDLTAFAPADLAGLISGHDAVINCAGHVTDGEGFVNLIDRVVTSVELLQPPRPVCWFLAGAALLDIGASGRRGVELPKLISTYWPHRINFERLCRSPLDWRILCPGPMVEQPPLGLGRMRISLDTLPVRVPVLARALPTPLLVPFFASWVPKMIVPYADAAALILANIDPGNEMSRHRIGLALPPGMRGRKPQWSPSQAMHRTSIRRPSMKRIRAGLALAVARALDMFCLARAARSAPCQVEDRGQTLALTKLAAGMRDNSKRRFRGPGLIRDCANAFRWFQRTAEGANALAMSGVNVIKLARCRQEQQKSTRSEVLP